MTAKIIPFPAPASGYEEDIDKFMDELVMAFDIARLMPQQRQRIAIAQAGRWHWAAA